MPHKNRTRAPKQAGRTGSIPGWVRNARFAGSLVATTAKVGSVASAPDSGWYRRLDKPAWQPPPAAFPIVWTSLYADIAVTSTLVLNELERRGDTHRAAEYRRALATNLALNGLWSWLFFRWHRLGAAAVGAGALAMSSVHLATLAGDARPAYRRLLSLYAGWTSFATVLAAVIWWRNRER
jgi:tryptophan-rich sensory protein